MGKTANCLKMLQLLSSGRVYKGQELADILETNVRNIAEYRTELEQAGYFIEGIPGKYGGYHLITDWLIPSVKLTDEEQNALSSGSEYLRCRNDFPYGSEYEKAIGKVFAAVKHGTPQDIFVSNRFPLAVDERELDRRYSVVAGCIAHRKELEMDYLSLSNKVSHRRFDPYKLFMYNNAWFMLGYDKKSYEIRYFKLSRIQSMTVTEDKFRILATYKESDYLDEFGMKKNGELHEITLRLHGRYAMLARERIYGRDQTVTLIDEDTTELRCTMQNEEDIMSFVMGFGSHCEVVSPGWLKDRVKDEARKILSQDMQ